jgi:hypothetical protein
MTSESHLSIPKIDHEDYFSPPLIIDDCRDPAIALFGTLNIR